MNEGKARLEIQMKWFQIKIQTNYQQTGKTRRGK